MVMIECSNCGKLIEKKGVREVCVKCANIRNREVAKKYREKKKAGIQDAN